MEYNKKSSPLGHPARKLARLFTRFENGHNVLMVGVSMVVHVLTDGIQTLCTTFSTSLAKFIAVRVSCRCIGDFNFNMPNLLGKWCLTMENWFNEGVATAYFQYRQKNTFMSEEDQRATDQVLKLLDERSARTNEVLERCRIGFEKTLQDRFGSWC